VALAKARIVDRGVATWHITVPFNRIGEEWGKNMGFMDRVDIERRRELGAGQRLGAKGTKYS
jgi:hypothetical protein